MRTFKRSGRFGPLTASTAALALLFSACGSGESGEVTLEQAATEQAEAQESSETTAAEAADPSAGEAESESEAEGAGPEVPTAHLFPDLQTVRVTDGETINLADELAGGDTPILLWFYAPH